MNEREVVARASSRALTWFMTWLALAPILSYKLWQHHPPAATLSSTLTQPVLSNSSASICA